MPITNGTSARRALEMPVMPASSGISRLIHEDSCSRVQQIDAGQQRLVLKTFRPGQLAKWRTFLCRSRGEREFVNLQRLREAQVPCVRPVAWDAKRRFGCVIQTEITTVFVEGGGDLRAALRALPRGEAASASLRRRLAARYGTLIRHLHDAGFVSTTLQPRNVLVGLAHGEMRLCDQPSLIRRRRSTVGSRAADLDLYDVAFSPARCRDFSPVERLRLVLAYSADNRVLARRIWRRLARRSRRRQHFLKELARGLWGR
jgi:tRNA A-37 threonylcarbamoyl transferase component Bud32